MEFSAAGIRTSLPTGHKDSKPRSMSTPERAPERAATSTAEAEVENEVSICGVSVRDGQHSSIDVDPPPSYSGAVEFPLVEDAPCLDETGGGRPGLGEGGELLSRASKTGSDVNVYDWGSSNQEECLTPTLRGVHRVAVQTRRSFEAIDRGILELESARKSGARGRTTGGDDDDDDMEQEEQSLSVKAANLHQSLTDVSVDDIDVRDVLAVVSGGSFNGVQSLGRGNLAAALAAAAVAGEVRDRGGAGGRDRGGAGERDRGGAGGRDRDGAGGRDRGGVGGRDRNGAGGRDRGDAGDVRARVDARDVLAVVSGGGINDLESRGRGNPASALAAAAVAGEVRDRGGAGGRDQGDAGDVRVRVDVRDVLAVVSGGGINNLESDGRENLASALAATAVAGEVRDRGGAGGRDRGDAGDVRARVGKRRGGVSGDRRSLGGGRGRTASSSEDSGALVLRTIARRPLKEMMRLEEAMEEESGEPVVRLEHLPPFTERWTPEALTPHILSQVFSGLVPMASRNEHGEPVCTYMLECCVRPDMEAVAILHVVSAAAAENGLELVRKRGGQVLYGVAPETTESRYPRPNQHQPSQRVGTWSVCRAKRGTAPPSPGTAVAPFPPRSAELEPEERVRTQEEEEEEYEGEYEERGVAGIRLSSAVSSDGGFEESAEKDRPVGAAASAEFVGWGGAGGAGWGPWSHVDMQLVVGQASKHRVLLIRFVRARTTACRDAVRVATAAAEIGEPLAIAPAAQNFVSGVRRALQERGMLMDSLEDFPTQEGRVMLDPHFLAQVEEMCQWDMVTSLREAGVSLDEHARNEELRGVVVTRMLEDMFELVGLPMLPPPPQLILGVPRANDILPASVEPMMDLSEEDEDELTGHVFADEASRVMATVLARCIRYTERCDEQMTARMQRKNRQVMQRISRSQLYQRELFQALRDGHMAVRRARLTTHFNKVFGARPEAGIDPNVETPVYFCTILSTRRPGVLYLTYWHLCVITRVPGFSPNVVVMPLEDIDAVEMIKLLVGYGIRVRKRATPGSSLILSPAPSSTASSAASSPAQPCRSNGQGDEPVAAKKTRPSTISFATAKVSTVELRELIVALVKVHREPVTSPSRAEAKAAAAAAARASSSL